MQSPLSAAPSATHPSAGEAGALSPIASVLAPTSRPWEGQSSIVGTWMPAPSADLPTGDVPHIASLADPAHAPSSPRNKLRRVGTANPLGGPIRVQHDIQPGAVSRAPALAPRLDADRPTQGVIEKGRRMGTREIPVSKGLVAIVDEEDYPEISKFTWHARKDGHFYYPATWVGPRKTRKYVMMHQMIMGVIPGKKIDHIDRKPLNNSRSNLRHVDHRTNCLNTAMWASNTSGYRGVSWHQVRRKWRSCIGVHGKMIDIGHFSSAEDAARAYDQAAREFFGEDAFVNFPDEIAS